MVRTIAAEDYLKSALSLALEGRLSVTNLASERGVSIPSASAVVAKFRNDGLMAADGPLELTENGRLAALAMVRKHRITETFLSEIVGVPLAEIHEEAERLEHGVSDALLERVDVMLGRPRVDPHGHPIPAAGATSVKPVEGTLLSHARVGVPLRIVSIDDHDAEAIDYLVRHGLIPGARVRIVERVPFDGPVWVEVKRVRSCHGSPVLDRVLVVTADGR